jgi:hypothetical protein
LLEEETPTLVRTVLAAGFEIDRVDRKPNFLALHARRVDEFGNKNRYLIAYAGDSAISESDAEVLGKLASHEGSALVIVSSNPSLKTHAALLTKSELFGKLGGVVSSVVPLEPEYGEHLVALASNKLPPGLVGTPDDMFERYAHAGLQFLLRGRVIRYGQERRFEIVPDGLIIATHAPLMLYDCKAASERFDFSQTTIRQFADYIKRFHKQYESYIGRLHSFLAISDEFQTQKTLLDRSNELYSECGVPLVCMTASTLGGVVSIFADRPVFRSVVDWKSLFVPPLIELKTVKEAVEARKRDRVVQG